MYVFPGTLTLSSMSPSFLNFGVKGDTVDPPGFWKALRKLFWLCGKMAYVMLPRNWVGRCTLGIIRSSFFLLPRLEGHHLGIPLYDELAQKKRDLIGGTQKWRDEEWPPEMIIATYGSAT